MHPSERSRCQRASALLVLALCVLAPRAHADEGRAAAEALFREGRRLLGAGQVDAACEKLAQSQKLDPSGGTLMNLADCHERQGKTASAWSGFVEAEVIARKEQRAA